MAMKLTFELSIEAATKAAIKAGAPDDKDLKLTALNIQHDSRFKMMVKDSKRYMILADYQNAGYKVINFEVA